MTTVDATSGHSILTRTWNEYRDWATLSRATKKSLVRWRKWVLFFALGGAILETVASYKLPWALFSEKGDGFGLAGAVFLALAVYFGRNVLGGSKEKAWVEARSVAEALQSEVMKYCTGTFPYDSRSRDTKLADKKKKLTESTVSLSMVPNPKKRADKPCPKEGMTIADYIIDRLKGQIEETDGYYWRTARQNKILVRRFRNLTLVLGAASVVLGCLGAFGYSGCAIWVAVITTCTTSLAAYFQASRYEYLVVSYSATARKLQNFVDEWLADQDPAKAAVFVSRCEETISFENKGWLAEWLKDPVKNEGDRPVKKESDNQ